MPEIATDANGRHAQLFRTLDIQMRVTQLAVEIERDHPGPMVVVVPMDGGFMFASDLLRQFRSDLTIWMPDVPSIRNGGAPALLNDPSGLGIQGAEVLIVEDIIDTGLTLAALNDRLLELGAASVYCAVLLDKRCKRLADYEPEYVGFPCPDLWVVGYGMDWLRKYRNLPYITFMETHER